MTRPAFRGLCFGAMRKHPKRDRGTCFAVEDPVANLSFVFTDVAVRGHEERQRKPMPSPAATDAASRG